MRIAIRALVPFSNFSLNGHDAPSSRRLDGLMGQRTATMWKPIIWLSHGWLLRHRTASSVSRRWTARTAGDHGLPADGGNVILRPSACGLILRLYVYGIKPYSIVIDIRRRCLRARPSAAQRSAFIFFVDLMHAEEIPSRPCPKKTSLLLTALAAHGGHMFSAASHHQPWARI